MGLERAGGVGGDGIGVSGVATLDQTLADNGGATQNGTPLFCKNMPSLSVIAIPTTGAGATILIQVSVRGDANVAATPQFVTIDTIVVAAGPGPAVLYERRFPANFFRVVMTPAAAVPTAVQIILGSAI
tara:strand:- start:82 stop:468 length:387 start_codon:yes stop_codon:yes gene_type:complete